MNRLLWLIPVLLLALIAGCDDDDPTQLETGASISGHVRDLAGNPVTDAALLLVDAGTLAPVGAPILPSETGRYSFVDLDAGVYAIFLYHDSAVVFTGTASRIELEKDQALTHDFGLVASGLWGPTDHTIAGVVRDAVTLEPVVGAYVGDIWSGIGGEYAFGELGGISLPEWGVTDADGRFEVGLNTMINESNQVVGSMPLTITASGYLPVTLVGEDSEVVITPDGTWSGSPLPSPAEGDSVLNVEVMLTPRSAAQPTELGALSGRLVYLGNPVAGVQVAATLLASAEVDTVATPEKVIIPDLIATSDAEGHFTINGLAPGVYSLAPGFPADDDWEGVNRFLTDPIYEVDANTTTAAGDVELIHTVHPVWPIDGATVPGSMPILQWEAVPGATHYQVQMAVNGYLLDILVDRTEVDSYQMLPAEAIPSGMCARWMVIALGDYPDEGDTIEIGITPWTVTFCVE